MGWEILDTGVASAEENMRLDGELLEQLDKRSRPLLHFYDWAEKSATFGYFVRPEQYLNLEKAKEERLDLGRRPTGGGIVFHIWDFAFSALVPASCPLFSENTLANYRLINEAVLQAIKKMIGEPLVPHLTPEDGSALDPSCERFCMARPTKYDVVLHGRKIAGAAQRQTKQGFLHQGTISLMRPNEAYLRQVLAEGSRVLEAMQAFTYPLLPDDATEADLLDARQKLKTCILQSLPF